MKPLRPALLLLGLSAALAATAAPPPSILDYSIKDDVISSGFDGRTHWMHPRAAVIPGPHPAVVLTLQKELLVASDVYFALSQMRTDDLGRTWTAPQEQATLGRRALPDGSITDIVDFTPQWHAATGRILGIGANTFFRNETRVNDEPMRPAYAVYDAGRRNWNEWRTVDLPDEARFYSVSAGCGQRVDRPDGEVLLPVYFKPKGIISYSVTVMRCGFDGTTLTYRGHGDVLGLPFDRAAIPEGAPYEKQTFIARQLGFFEPSLTYFQGRYFLTLRNVRDNYVAAGTDGQHFGPAREWRFDDGGVLGSEDTQTHWVTHSDGLFLTYTRRGAGNDRVFRHRAPIFIAQVDPARLVLLRSTERILVPEHGAALGNFGVVNVTPAETWVTTSESMQAPGKNMGDYHVPQGYGADNRVYVARLIWRRPNRMVAMADRVDLGYRVDLRTVHAGFDGKTCWMCPMAGVVPGPRPRVVLAMQKLLMTQSDVFFALNTTHTDDLGRSWSPLVEHESLGRRPAENGMTVGITAPVLQWHAPTRRLLAIGETSYYRGDKLDREGAQRTAYSVYHPAGDDWTPWATVDVPPDAKFHSVNEGCCQRVDLPDGTILLPVYHKAKGITAYSSTVLRLSFDGKILKYLGQGDELTLPFDAARLPASLNFDRKQFLARQSGLFEPSLIRLGSRFYLTMRNVRDDYVAVGSDGQHFGPPQEWRFDDGAILDSENTQTHWVSHASRLYLIYTRRGANNDNVFRHRAPLFMARVDPVRLRLIRATEKILIPNRGAALGGSVGVTDVNAHETWITTSESMQGSGKDPSDYSQVVKYGANGRVYAARILWN